MHPRYSILNLFDPLASEAPSRDAPSPDSDKENSSPPIDTDISFFGRAPKQASPVRLKRRLVDVGDITTDDPTMLSMLTEEDELDESMCDDENDTFTLPRFELPTATPTQPAFVQQVTPANTSPRTPLGDLSLDLTPVPRNKMFRRPPPPPSALAFSDALPTSTETSSFASVIDAVTASGASFADPVNPSPEYHNHDYINEPHSPNNRSDDIKAPIITVTSSDELGSSTCTLNLDTPATLLKDTSQPIISSHSEPSSDTSLELPRATLRPNPARTSSQDPNRRSIDLYSSFHLQLTSEEASFDLLNDKISFFTSLNTMDSFLNEGDSFDMVAEEAKLQATIESIKPDEAEEKAIIEVSAETTQLEQQDLKPEINDTSQTSSPRPAKDLHFELSLQTAMKSVELSPLPKESSVTAPVTPSPKFMGLKVLRRPSVRSIPNSPVPLTTFKNQDSKRVAPTSSLATTVMTSPPAPVFVAPTREQNPDPVVLCTPAPEVRARVLPAPVPALRIVKRSTRRGYENSSSSSSVSSASSDEPAPAQPANVASSSTLTTQAPPITRHISSLAASTRRLSQIRPVAPTSSALPPLRSVAGPRRAPIVEGEAQSINKLRGIAGPKTLPQGSLNGPRRVIVAPSVPAAAAPAAKTTAVSGIRAPTKYGVGSGAGASALPRPVSRLPTSTASLARPRSGVGASAGTEGVPGQGTGIARRAAPTRRVAQ
ncbi:hypothetical protein DXG01_011886 [Tephrocybe rancida]|nr:hypothetical protein DXG01_011886 [Tephrocybe rancida]